MKIDWKKEISLPKLRRPSLPSRSSKSALDTSTRKPRRATPKLSRPSLGGPELQMPKFVTDLYADLRDRHLLPLVALLIVAIIAAPLLLAGGGDAEPAAITPAGVEGETKEAGLTVVPAEDGLRNYKRRLGHRNPLDPFRRPPEAEASKGESSSSGTNSNSGSEGGSESASSVESSSSAGQEVITTTVGGVTTEKVESSSSEPERQHHKQNKSGQTESSGGEATEASEATEATSPEPTTPSTPEVSESSKPAESTRTEASNGGTSESSAAKEVSAVVGYTIDAEAGFVPKTSEKTGITPMTKLPNKKHPLVLFIGLSKNHKRALFLMTSNVTAYYGGHCALDKQACQLVEVAPGKGVTFAAGYGDSRYKLHVERIIPVVKHAH
jgi:hypothetical protein